MEILITIRNVDVNISYNLSVGYRRDVLLYACNVGQAKWVIQNKELFCLSWDEQVPRNICVSISDLISLRWCNILI